jgi:hypothetical protein
MSEADSPVSSDSCYHLFASCISNMPFIFHTTWYIKVLFLRMGLMPEVNHPMTSDIIIQRSHCQNGRFEMNYGDHLLSWFYFTGEETEQNEVRRFFSK